MQELSRPGTGKYRKMTKNMIYCFVTKKLEKREKVMIEYREMKDAELRRLYDFAAPIWRECYAGILEEGHIALLTHRYFDYVNVRRFRQEGMRYAFVLYHGQKAGFLAYMLREDHVYLDKIYLQRDFRGKHISSAAFDYLTGRYQKPVRLNVNRENTLGMRAYLGRGFRIVGTETYDLPGGYVNQDYIMEKPVLPRKP
jgi:hypothetical protein